MAGLDLCRKLFVAVASLCMTTSVFAADFTMKVAFSEPRPEPGSDDYHHARTPVVAFEKEVEKKSGGRIDIQVFWGGQLGKLENVVNLVRGGQVEAAIVADGHVAPYFSDIQVLGLPYLFIERRVAYDVLDGPAGQALAEKMAQQVAIRPVWLENGGYRHYSSNRRVARAADMADLKIRTMNNPVHMEIVRALGASPTPIPWSDIYTSLQTGVVDGQENSLATFRIPRLEEVQSHIVLDGHVYSVLMLALSEKWLESLPRDLRNIVIEAGVNMQIANRRISAELETVDRTYLEGAGVTITDLSVSEKQKFQEMTQGRVLELLRESVSAQTLESFLTAVKAAEAKL